MLVVFFIQKQKKQSLLSRITKQKEANTTFDR